MNYYFLPHAAAAFVLSAAVWPLLRENAEQNTAHSAGRSITLGLWALVVGLSVSGSRWFVHLSTYSSDTYFSLSLLGRAALALLSLALILSLCNLAWLLGRTLHTRTQLSKPLQLVFGIITLLMGFWIAVTLAPQIYYTLYLSLFDQLPLQWVLKPISVRELMSLIAFRSAPTFASTLIGASFWATVVSAAAGWFHERYTENGSGITTWKLALAVAFGVLCTNLALQIG